VVSYRHFKEVNPILLRIMQPIISYNSQALLKTWGSLLWATRVGLSHIQIYVQQGAAIWSAIL